VAVVQTIGCTRAASPAAAAATVPVGAAAVVASKTGCVAMNIGETMAQAERLQKTGRPKEALAAVVRALGCKQDYWMYQSAVQYACAASDEASAQLYFPNAPAAFQPILEAQCKQNNINLRSAAAETETKASPTVSAAPACENVDGEALVQQATKQYLGGDVKGALATVLKALACKHDMRLYRFAVTYACAAQDLVTAKLYFTKVADPFKSNLEQKCQQEGLDVRSP
jgi:hypothetical protein